MIYFIQIVNIKGENMHFTLGDLVTAIRSAPVDAVKGAVNLTDKGIAGGLNLVGQKEKYETAKQAVKAVPTVLDQSATYVAETPYNRVKQFGKEFPQPGPLRPSKLLYKFSDAEVEVPTTAKSFELFKEKTLITAIDGAPRDINGFNAIDMGGNQTFKARLVDPANDADTKLKTALEHTPETKDAIKDFEGSIKAVQALYDDKYPMSPVTLANYLTGIRAEGVKALDAQFIHDKKALLTCFEDPAFKTALCARTGIDAAELPSLQNKMLKAQEDAHKTAKANLQKETDALLGRLYQNNQLDEAKIRYLQVMHENNKKMRKDIDAIIAKNPNPQNITLSMNVDDGKIDFSNVDIKDLHVIQTLTGRQIKRDEGGNFSMEQPKSNFPYIFNKYYYHSSAFEVDAKSLAMAVRAAGHEAITMNFDTRDDKDSSLAFRGGRTQIRACLDAGFKPEDITINVNGVKYRYEPTKAEKDAGVKSFAELYQNSPSSEQKQYSDKLKLSQEIDLQPKGLSLTAQARTDELKAAVKHIKDQNKQQGPAPGGAGGPGGPGGP